MTRSDRGRQPALMGLVGATLSVVLAACAEPAQPVGPPEITASPSAAPTPDARLTVLHRDGSKDSIWQLTCAPTGGTHPDPQTACQALDDNDGAALAPVDSGTMCTQVYAGPDTATIRGTWRGREVSSTFKLTNGCEIARWEALVGLLPPISS